MVESSVSPPCALCLCGSSSYTVVITSGERRSTTETQSSQSTHRAPNQELENHRNLWLATGNSEEPYILGLLAQGISMEAILEEYPGLAKDDIYACLLFASKSLQDASFVPLGAEAV